MTFTPAEHRTRIARAAAAARDEGLAGVIVADPANLHYLTGYNAWSFYMPQVLVIDASTAEVLFIARDMDAKGAHRTAMLEPHEIVGYPESTVHRRDTHPFVWAARELRERCWATRFAGGRVAIEGDADFFSVRAYLSLRDGLPEWEFVDGHRIISWLRVIKSDKEIELMRGAGRIVSNAMSTAIDMIAAGVPQHELVAAIWHAQISGVPGADGDYPAIVPMLPTGGASDTPH
ncbi:MAG: aminopeptidase P family N-terminal domain-containing protein, partial [Pseudoclavibacter sp.]